MGTSIILCILIILLSICSWVNFFINRKLEKQLKIMEVRLKEKDEIINHQDAKMEQMEKDISFLERENQYHKPFEIKRTTIPFKTYICEAFDRQLDPFRFDVRSLEYIDDPFLKKEFASQLADQIVDDVVIKSEMDPDKMTVRYYAEIYVGLDK